MAEQEKKTSYLQQRVYDLYGLTPEQCAVPLKVKGLYGGWVWTGVQCKRWTDADGEHEVPIKDEQGNEIPVPFPLFKSDDDDNIRIYPYTLDGHLIQYARDKQPKYAEMDVEDTYYITRMNAEWLKKQPRGTAKYRYPGGETKKGTYPFFPPALYDKFQKGEHIETVILTEGYFKAMCASVHGMNVIGLGSVTLYKDSKTKQLYPDIVRFLNVVKPDNIVILYDADCTDLGENALLDFKEGKMVDLSKRPQGFLHVLLKLKDLLLEFKNAQGNPCEIFFAYVNRMFDDEVTKNDDGTEVHKNDSPKGLDDLIVDPRFKDEVDKIAEDLNHPGRTGVYFFKKNLRTCNDGNIRAVFNLSNPEMFYTEWEWIIKNKTFKYQGATYTYSPTEKKLIKQLDEELSDYVAIGSEIVLVTDEPIPNTKATSTRLIPKSDKVINARYGEKTAQRLYKYRYYEDYTFFPDHINYSHEVINSKGYRFYNMYSPLPYKPVEGSWKHIEKLLKQLTKEYDEDTYHYYEMLLDWITLTYFRPMEKLPIITLVSKERKTGKTSFLNLLKYIYGNNAVIGGNDLIMSKFNNLLAGKLIVGIDESCLGENKEVGETLKYLSTSNTVHVELKGKDKTEKPAFFKFVLASNELRKAVFVGKDEVRFWVMRLTPWADENVDLSFDKMIEEEVPAFLWALQKRYNEGKMYVPEWEDRMWFKAKRLINKDLETMMDGTSSNVEGSLRNYMHDLFLDTNRLKLEFDLKYILDHIDGAKRRGENSMRIMLEDMEGVYRDGGQRKVAMPEYVTEEDIVLDSNLELGSIKWPTRKTTCRPYTFDAKYFLNPSEYQTIALSKKPPVTPKQQTMDFDQQPSAPADANQPATTDGAKAEGEELGDPW